MNNTCSLNNEHDSIYADLADHIYDIAPRLHIQESLQEGSLLVAHSKCPPLILRRTALCGGWWRVAGNSTDGSAGTRGHPDKKLPLEQRRRRERLRSRWRKRSGT